mgnify:CR=1 FL=1
MCLPVDFRTALLVCNCIHSLNQGLANTTTAHLQMHTGTVHAWDVHMLEMLHQQ